jgi:hypothetical protein
LRSAFTESDSVLLLELLSPDAGAPPAAAFGVSVVADVADVLSVVLVSALSVIAVLLEVVERVWLIETDVMLTMGGVSTKV